MRHRRTELIRAEALAEAIARTPMTHHVLWIGREATGQRGSLRARAFDCLHEVGVPVSLRVLLQRAAQLPDGTGLDPDAVRSAIRLHQGAKPAVVFLLERRPSGEFVAVTDIPFAGSCGRRISAGEVVVDRGGRFGFDLFADAA